MTSRFSLAGKHALITGGTRGIGLAIARGFLEAGAEVTVCGRKQEGVDAALQSLSGQEEKVLGVAAHVGKQVGRVCSGEWIGPQRTSPGK
mgnify:CR=1 FL=1